MVAKTRKDAAPKMDQGERRMRKLRETEKCLFLLLFSPLPTSIERPLAGGSDASDWKMMTVPHGKKHLSNHDTVSTLQEREKDLQSHRGREKGELNP